MKQYTPQDHIEFLSKRYNIRYRYVNDGVVLNLIIKVEHNDETREYDPIPFLDYSLHYFLDLIDRTVDLGDRIKLAYDGKMATIYRINMINEEISMSNKDVRKYNFQSIIAQADIAIDKLRVELEVEKHGLEVKKLRNETRWYKEPIVILSTIILVIGFFSGLKTCNGKASATEVQKYSNAENRCYNNNGTFKKK